MVSFLMILGSLAAAGGGIGYFAFPLGLNIGVKSMINLKENGMIYPLYMNPPFGTKSEFRLFSIQNPKEVLKGGKMKLDLKGPYYYDTYLVRDNVSFSKQGEKIKFDSHRKLYLDTVNSADLDEKMWLLNPIVPSIQKMVRLLVIDRLPFQRISEPIVFNSVNVLLDSFKERLIVRTTPRTILQGRKIQLLQSILDLTTRFGFQANLPGPPGNIYGLAFVQNETVDKSEIYTGVGSTVDKFADVATWRGKQIMDIWKGKCNIINGTNGELYKPFIEGNKSIRIFLGLLCRSLFLDPVGDSLTTTKSGVKAFEYEFSARTYQGARSNPANRCYCKDLRAYDCQYDGLINMSPCFFESPIYFAMPNFKGSDRRIRDTTDSSIMNTKPIPDKQSFYIEPITGTLLQVNLTFLAVFKIIRQPYMRDLAKIQNLTYAPLFSTSEIISVPANFVWQIYILQFIVNYYKPIMVGTALTGSGLMFVKVLM